MSTKRRIRKILIAFFLIAVLVTGTLTAKLYLDYRKAGAVYGAIADEYTLPADEAPAETERAPITVDFKALCGDAPDCVGWLYSEGTPINYPVMRGGDNDEYLHSLSDGAYSFAGSIFMDFRASADLSDARTVLYGHNMLNDSMFGTLDGYTDEAYAAQHDVLYLLTPRQNYRLDVLGAIYAHDGAELYEPMQDAAELPEFIAQMRAESFTAPMHTDGEYEKVCCLSTCAYVFENARLVLVCGMVPIG